MSSLGKILTNNFGSQKNDRFEKILGQEIFLGQKIFLVQKKFESEKCGSEKNLVSKRFESKKYVGLIKNIFPKNILGPKNDYGP